MKSFVCFAKLTLHFQREKVHLERAFSTSALDIDLKESLLMFFLTSGAHQTFISQQLLEKPAQESAGLGTFPTRAMG